MDKLLQTINKLISEEKIESIETMNEIIRSRVSLNKSSLFGRERSLSSGSNPKNSTKFIDLTTRSEADSGAESPVNFINDKIDIKKEDEVKSPPFSCDYDKDFPMLGKEV